MGARQCRPELVTASRGGPVSIPDPVVGWAATQLRPEHVTRLESLPLAVTLDIGRLGPTLFCHATPRDDEEVVLVDSRPERWAEVFSTLDASVSTVVCGHTHMPFVRLVDRRLVVNPGSVGMPYGGPGAHWVLLTDDGPVVVEWTYFDLDTACPRIAAESAYPQAAQFADYYVRSRASDIEALRVFGPRDGRAPAAGA